MTHKTLSAAALSFLLHSFATPAFAGTWQEIYTEDAVTVSKKEVDGSKFVAFKGETKYDAPLDKVLYVLMDNDHRTEWVDRLYECRILEQYTEHKYVLYQAFELPAIFSDRDYVYQGEVTRDASTGVVTLQMNSVEHAEAPPTIGVRADLVNSRYVLTPDADGGTHIEVEIMTDPQGAMPAWLVNLIQRSWPVETLNGIRVQIGKPYTGSYPLPGVVDEPEAEAGADEAGATEGADAEGTEAEPSGEAEAGDADADEATEGEAAEGAEAEAGDAPEAAEAEEAAPAADDAEAPADEAPSADDAAE